VSTAARRAATACFVLVALATTSAAEKLPRELGGGGVPPDFRTLRAEDGEWRAIGTVTWEHATCIRRGVRAAAARPDTLDAAASKAAACQAAVRARYARTIDRLASGPIGTVECAQGHGWAGQTQSLMQAFAYVITCEGGTEMPASLGSGMLPPTPEIARGEDVFAHALMRLGSMAMKCYRKAIANVFHGRPHRVAECVGDAQRGAWGRFHAILATAVPPRAVVPACLDVEAVSTTLVNLISSLSYTVYCLGNEDGER